MNLEKGSWKTMIFIVLLRVEPLSKYEAHRTVVALLAHVTPEGKLGKTKFLRVG